MASGLILCEHCGQKNRVAARQTGAAPLAALRTWVENALAGAAH